MKRFYFSYNGKTVWKTAAEVTAAASLELKSEDFINRRLALGAMHEVHHQIGEFALVHMEMPGLVDMLHDEDAGCRYWSMATISSLAANAIFESCEAIAKALTTDLDPGVRTYAAIALGKIGHECDAAFDYIPDIQDCLEDSDPQVRIECVKALTEMIEDEDLAETAEIMVKSLKDRRFPIFRASAAEALGYLGPAGLPHVEALGVALDDKYPRVREAAAKALGRLGVAAMKDNCVALANLALTDPDPGVKSAAEMSLHEMDLDAALHHEDPVYRRWACERIATVGLHSHACHHASAKILIRLGELLKDDDATVRQWCAQALGDAGEEAKQFLPVLLHDGANDPDATTRVVAVKACVKLDQEETKTIVKAISKSLKHKDQAFRLAAAQSLGAMGVDALTEAKWLNAALSDKDPLVRVAAVHAITNMGKQAVRACGERLGKRSNTDPDYDVRKWSAYVLHEFGLAARYGAPEKKKL